MVSIARYSPKTFDGLHLINDERFNKIIPATSLLFDYKNNKITNKQYAIRYIEQLKDIDFNCFCTSYNEAILLCYESSQAENYFCHRAVLVWYMNKYGYEIKEF